MNNIKWIKNPNINIKPKKKPMLLYLQKSEMSLPYLINAYNVVIVYAYADWCRPCKIIAPQYEELAKKYAKHPLVLFCKDDISSPKSYFTGNYSYKKINGVPSLFIFHKAKMVKYILGGDLKQLEETLQSILDTNKCPPISTNFL